MKAFIERVFKSKKQKQKELMNEIITTEVEKQTTEDVVETNIKEVKNTNHIDCECQECIDRIKQHAK